MSGHMLATINPEAAAAIQPGPESEVARAAGWLPVGTVVQYFCRPGEGRDGKSVFPAIVTSHGERGVNVIVFSAYDELVSRLNLPRRDEQNPNQCWDYVPGPKQFAPVAVDARAREKIDALTAEVEVLRANLRDIVASSGKVVARTDEEMEREVRDRAMAVEASVFKTEPARAPIPRRTTTKIKSE